MTGFLVRFKQYLTTFLLLLIVSPIFVIESIPKREVTVELNTNNGFVFIDEFVGYAGDELFLPTPTRSNYIFDGWYTDSSFTKEFTRDTFPRRDTELYAKWIPRPQVTITFNPNGGSLLTTSRTGYTGSSIILPTPSRTNYIFDGWYTNSSLTIPFTSSIFPSSSQTLYAKWIPRATVTITFNPNGGSVTPTSRTGYPNDSLTLPTPTRSNYVFDGWYTNLSLTNRFTGFVFPSSSMTLYAKWTFISQVTVAFNANGGSVTPTSRTGYSGSSLSLPTPTRTGYTFNGWYTTSSLSTLYTSDLFPSSNTTLYAGWTQNTQNGSSLATAVTMESLNTNYLASITTAGSSFYFKYTPSVSGSHRFYSTGNYDTYGVLYNSNGTQLAFNDDGTGLNFSITYTLSAGQTYYIAARFYSTSTTGSFNVIVTR